MKILGGWAGAMLLALGAAWPLPGVAASGESDGDGVEAPLPTIPVAEPPEPEDDDLDWHLAGNLQVDALAKSDLPADRRKTVELRKARLNGVLDWDFDWRLKAGAELGRYGGLRDFSVEYRGWPVALEVGRFAEPFGLLQASSSGMSFLERPQAAALTPGYGIGAAVNLGGDRWGLTAGVFRATRNEEPFGGRSENAMTARATFTPVRTDDWLLHVGGGASWRQSADGFLRFVAIPESTLLLGLETRSADLLTDRYALYGLELAALHGPVLLQAEYFSARVSDSVLINFSTGDYALAQPAYASYYVEAAWTVTGERRDYSTRHGTFSSIHPRRPVAGGGWGAVELAARYSNTDFSDATVGGDHGRATSMGLNWFPLENVKLMLDGLRIDRDSGGSRDKDFAVQLRAQLHFTAP